MNLEAIKAAIEHYEYGVSHDIFSEPVTTYAKIAIAALRECAEREKGCEWCKGFDHVMTNGIHKIYFCPMCGRKLERSDT